MALSKEEVALYAYITGRVLPKGTTRRAFNLAVAGAIRAAQLVAPVAGRAAATAIPAIGTAAAAAPITTGAALGLGALATPPGQELLEMARERGRQDRIDFDEMLATGRAFVESPTGRGQIKTKAKRTLSKYNKAVKQSKFAGKKGVINNPKQVFGTVNKVVSAVNKKRKVIPKGIRGAIAKAAKKVLK